MKKKELKKRIEELEILLDFWKKKNDQRLKRIMELELKIIDAGQYTQHDLDDFIVKGLVKHPVQEVK